MEVSPRKSGQVELELRRMRGLDGANFFVAAVQTGFGAFVAVYLVKSHWPPQSIGFALTIATMSALVSQIPAGAVLDTVQDKRWPVLFGIVGVGVAALLLGVSATEPAVYLALVLQGLSSSLIAPGITAISLALVGEPRLSERIGRNARFASIGSGLAAGVMGFAGSYLPPVSVFFVAAALAVPALLAVFIIGPGRARRASRDQPAAEARTGHHAPVTWQGLKSIVADRRLVIFVICVVLFFAASAAVGPGLAAIVTRRQPGLATLVVAATILLPQAIVAAISPWIGRQTKIIGRRPLLLAGWGLLPFQGALYAAFPGPYALVACYLLNAVSGAIFGVLLAVVAADITRHSGCFNLVLGALGVAISIGASLSTFFAGLSASAFGDRMTALGLALVGLCGLLVVWAGMPETRPRQAVAEPGLAAA